MKNCEHWIWLSTALGDAARIDDIINYFGSAKELYEAGSYEWKISGLFNGRQIDRLNTYTPGESDKIVKVCENNKWQIVTPDDGNYPPNLKNICDYPSVLYVMGDSQILSDELCIAMVGTRKASGYGIRVASVLAGMLSKTGLTVISGGALGIDSASHTGAMYSGGKTIAVLGCGLGANYLMGNEALRNEISNNGAVITEYPPFSQATKYNFPKRNRIISGMALGTVVVEAGERSGSLITARMALEQNRDVFAVPGDVFSSAFTGANRLISDGAKPVFTAKDVAQEYYHRYPDRIKLENSDEPLLNLLKKTDKQQFANINTKISDNTHKDFRKPDNPCNQNTQEENSAVEITRELPDDVSETVKLVYNSITHVTEFDDICTRTSLGTAKVLSAVTQLEMLSMIEVLPGKKYKKI